GLEPVAVDGNDVEAVYRAAVEALRHARDGEGPVLIEADTYRHGGHSRADPGTYRPKEEVDAWLARDPIPAYRKVLVGDGVPESDLDAMEDEVRGDRVAGEPGVDLLLR